MKSALIFHGGWQGHEPFLIAKRFGKILTEAEYTVELSDSFECLRDKDKLMSLDLIVPCWTMGTIDHSLVENVSAAVASGVGLAGLHGGMCDAFRNDTEWQFMTGGQWVSHPGNDGVEYTVNIMKGSSPIVEGLDDFTVRSEQYYLHIDPAIEVLATTRFPVANYYHTSNKPVDMPVAWTKFWGHGRVFYTSLGHHDELFDICPTALEMLRRGVIWAGEGKEYAVKHSLDKKDFEV